MVERNVLNSLGCRRNPSHEFLPKEGLGACAEARQEPILQLKTNGKNIEFAPSKFVKNNIQQFSMKDTIF